VAAAEPDLTKIAQIANLVSEQALRAGKIIHRMKAFCQNQNTSLARADINALIKDSILLCNSDLKKHNIILHLALAESLPMLFIDSIKIEQVLINLIRNSTEALIAKDTLHKNITVSSLMVSEYNLQIQIKDNGSGMEQALQEQLFMPFFTTKTEGMGMGLSICRSLITAHHGTLTFDSQQGLGTCFYITLPLEVS
jgi:C4-dicarboxylate-specific signal transduction histidine kinase